MPSGTTGLAFPAVRLPLMWSTDALGFTRIGGMAAYTYYARHTPIVPRREQDVEGTAR